MENFLNRLNRNPYQPIDGASVTKFDELGNGLDDWGNVIAPKFEAPQQTWGETALGVATAPARLATALAGSLSPYGADGWQVPPVAQEGWNALTAVGDAYTQGMSEDEMRNRALGMAGFMMGGGGPALALERSLPQAGVSLGDRVVAKYLDWKHPDAQSTRNVHPNDAHYLNYLKQRRQETDGSYARHTLEQIRNMERSVYGEPLTPYRSTYEDVLPSMTTREGGQLVMNQSNDAGAGLAPSETGYMNALLQSRKPEFDVIDGGLYSNASKEGGIPALASALGAEKTPMDMALEGLRRAVDDDLGDKSPYWNMPIEPRDLTLYHGTGSAFDRFNTPDVWASDSADMASNWAMRKDNPSVIPLEVKGARITRPKDQTLDPEAERARALAEGYDAIDWGKFDGGHYYQLVRPGTVKSPTTGETLFSNASKEGAVPALASALDMSPEARLARAREMGFDTDRTLYHGTDKEFDAFAPSRDGSLGSGVYLTPSEAYAGKYGQNILETYVRGNILDETDVPASVSRGLSGPWKRNRTPATAVADWARANGYDGIRQEGFQTVVFDPKNIRSVNAAFDPAMSDSANLLAANADSKPALLASALGQEQKGITAYHGSPHDFDKFDLSKIGSGEGAQAYGHGLYFAENEGVARSYRDNLGGGDLYIKGEKQPFVGAGYAQDTVNRQLMRNHGNVEETMNWLNSEIDTLQRRGVDEDTLGEFLAARDNLSGAAAENAVKFDQGGKMYQVRINADPNDFLDWDKPLSQQSEKVRQAMVHAAQAEAETKMARRRLEASKAEMMGMKWSQPDPIDPMSLTGADLWDRVPENSGIPGTRYLDQMSRDAGDGSYNYAVWDDSLIEILKKYGWLVPGAGYGANALSQGQENQY